MQLKGDVTIRAPRKKVWDFMTDPEQIGQCAPGVEKIEVIEPLKKYKGTVSIGFGAVKARFSGEVDILELDEPNRAKLKAHGTASGSAATLTIGWLPFAIASTSLTVDSGTAYGIIFTVATICRT